jgi:hypothetical protein
VKLEQEKKKKEFEKTEQYLKNIETIGQYIGEVL